MGCPSSKSESYLEPRQTSQKTKPFAIYIINFILDVWQGFEYYKKVSVDKHFSLNIFESYFFEIHNL